MSPRHRKLLAARFTRLAVPILALTVGSCRREPENEVTTDIERQGRQIFRYDTFGDERFWTDTAQLHKTLGPAVLVELEPGLTRERALPERKSRGFTLGTVRGE